MCFDQAYQKMKEMNLLVAPAVLTQWIVKQHHHSISQCNVWNVITEKKAINHI